MRDIVYGLAPCPPELASDYIDASRLAASQAWPATYADLLATPERIVTMAEQIRSVRARKAQLEREAGD